MPTPQRSPTGDEYAKLVLSMNPAVYYRMEEWPKGKDEDTYVLVDSAPGGHHGILHGDRAFGPRCHGRFGKALDLHGPGVGDYAVVQDYPQTDTGQLSVSAWVWAVSLPSGSPLCQSSRIFAIGGSSASRAPVNSSLAFNHVHCPCRWASCSGGDVRFAEGWPRDGKACAAARDQWQHVAFVADGAMLRLYRNGVEVDGRPATALPPIRL